MTELGLPISERQRQRCAGPLTGTAETPVALVAGPIAPPLDPNPTAGICFNDAATLRPGRLLLFSCF